MSNKPIQPQLKIVGFFHGIDPATQNDYYTDFVHVLTEKPRTTAEAKAADFKWIPFLADILRVRQRDPMDMTDLQIRMFNKYPPTYAIIDSTREAFLANALVRKYGETHILPMHFGNAGSVNTKFSLKQIGYEYINAGYEWPDTTKIEQTHPRLAKLIKILKKEMMREIVTYTNNDRVTFDHPIGKHNDMVHGWEMSLKAVMEWQQLRLGNERRREGNSEFKTIHDDIYKKYPRSNQDEELENVPIYDRKQTGAFSLR